MNHRHGAHDRHAKGTGHGHHPRAHSLDFAPWKPTLDCFDAMRQKRNRLTCKGDVAIGRVEAEASLAEASRICSEMEKLIGKLRPSKKT